MNHLASRPQGIPNIPSLSLPHQRGGGTIGNPVARLQGIIERQKQPLHSCKFRKIHEHYHGLIITCRIFMIEFNMRILTLTQSTTAAAVREAISILKDGGLIAYPTESFYALGVMATDKEAVSRLFRLKKRPPEKPLPVIVGNIETLETIIKSMPDQAIALIKKYWPGPLNIIFEAKDHIPLMLTGGSHRIAVRIPGDKTAFNLAIASKLPITATSANPSALPPAKNANEVKNYFDGEIDLIIDNGETAGGKPSTIVDATTVPFRILREGCIRLEC